jgi:hypothetical protein
VEVNPPGPVQLNVYPVPEPPLGLAFSTIDVAHGELVVIVTVGLALTVTSRVQELRQPAPDATLSVNVNEPAAPALTVTEAPEVDPAIEPFPLIDQLWVAMAVPEDMYVRLVVPEQTEVLPEIEHDGFGLIITVALQRPVHPRDEVTLSVTTIIVPIAPAVTVTVEVPWPDVIIPFVTDHEWVAMFVPVDENIRPAAPVQAAAGPAIPQVGFGLTVTVELAVAVAVLPKALPVAVTVLVVVPTGRLVVSVNVAESVPPADPLGCREAVLSVPPSEATVTPEMTSMSSAVLAGVPLSSTRVTVIGTALLLVTL